MEKIMCDCGHIENDHSKNTRGYATNNKGKTICYDCALAEDIRHLRAYGSIFAYIDPTGKYITTWPGLKIAAITGSHKVNFGFRRNQISFNAIMEDGTQLYGYGPGNGMFCRVKTRKPSRSLRR